MTKSLVALRTIHVPGPKYKPAKIDPVTGGHLEAGTYDVKTIEPGKSFDLADDDEAEKLVANGCAKWSKDDKEPVLAPAPNPPVPPKK